MGVLSDLEPKNVFHFFEEITKIPHGSGNVGRISDYLVDFAKERGLFCIQDEWKNVIIVKEAAPGYEDEPAVILQGHMDMVAVKKPDCDIDMRTEGLRVAVDGDRVYAEGTSLGGDDGIAVAYSLALLDSHTIKHPRLEVILTVDEEVGMDGARAIDLSMLTGHRMINLDSEEEGIFLTSCAGGARVKCRLSLSVEESRGILYRVTVGGLLGGHSGGEIHKERGNSNCLFGRVLKKVSDRIPVRLCQVKGGLADNAIPRETTGLLLVGEKDCAVFVEILSDLEKEIRAELVTKDPGFYINAETVGEEGCFRVDAAGTEACTERDAAAYARIKYRSVSAADTKKAADLLAAMPNGVQAMSADMPGLVETSLNLGILEFDVEQAQPSVSADGEPDAASAAQPQAGSLVAAAEAEKKKAVLLAEFSVRSSLESAKHALIDKLCAITDLAGGSNEVTGDYPGWAYRKDSPLRDKMAALYEKMYGQKPKVEAIHAGLECGILGSKIRDLDCVSIGPQMTAIHTTEETLSISSTRRVWEYLVTLLEEKDG
ncbi:MAG: aminoacyl-histidine dipeptidase [Lachnospiraceae bacterium]|nr:aminoacyl-histidine dipeptidase [Lachnospiraceae bacterium]MCM1241181.1 aminoacyl-histidine dipeptidase [Lachnospiraceae bacterium]